MMILHLEDYNCDIEHHFSSATMQNAHSLGVSLTNEHAPNDGVIVADIFAGKHHYTDMKEAQTLTDFFSGLSIHTIDTTPSFDGTSNEGPMKGLHDILHD